VKVGASPAEPARNASTLAMPTAEPANPPSPAFSRRGEQPPSLPHGDAEADRRTVTVLFADLSGFTALSERLDPEELRALQNDLFAELTAAVHAFDGFVDKFIGDALLALFGAPVAHEDDPERALRAALEMLGRAARIAGSSAAYAGEPLLLHIGINTGPVVTGGFGSGNAKSFSVTGDTVNTAQRLQSLAAPGEILVGPLTHRLTRHAFTYESLGDVALRGKAGSVLVHRLVEPLESPRAVRGLETLGLSAPLIGRDAELGRMLASLDQACGGSAQLIRLVGEAGSAKRAWSANSSFMSARRSGFRTLPSGRPLALRSASNPMEPSARSCAARRESCKTPLRPKCGRNWPIFWPISALRARKRRG
jgi:class 3 adenylate cyclase